MSNKIRLGKIRKNVKGFDIREILKGGSSTGEVGLYRGKKLATGAKSIYKANDKGIADATKEAITLAENSRRFNKRKNDYLKRTNPIRAKHKSNNSSGREAYLKRISKK